MNIIENYVFINGNKILLKKHHNSYYFIHKEDLKKDYEKKLFAVKKVYQEDYPFIGDKTLIVKNFYLIKEKLDILDGEWIDLREINEKLENQRYDNPRVQDVLDEILEITNLLNFKDIID